MESLQQFRESRLKDLIKTLENSIVEADNMQTRGLDGEVTETSYARITGHLLATITIALIHLREVQVDQQE